MTTSSDPYSNCAWLEQRRNGLDGELWRKAQLINLLSKCYTKKLRGFRVSYIDPDDKLKSHSDRQTLTGTSTWGQDSSSSVRKLLDIIVTEWNPDLLDQVNIPARELHNKKIQNPFKPLNQIGTSLNHSSSNLKIQAEFSKFCSSLTTLHYSETWASMLHDFQDNVVSLQDRPIVISVKDMEKMSTASGTKQTAIIVGTIDSTIDDSFKHSTKAPSLFDVLRMNLDGKNYFGVIVCVRQIRIKKHRRNPYPMTASSTVDKVVRARLRLVLGMYCSEECANVVVKQRETMILEIPLRRISNITSPARMIQAIDEFDNCPHRCSLIFPKVNDTYFGLSSTFSMPTEKRPDYNLQQTKIIDIAEHMYADDVERLHLVLGPPGKTQTFTIH
ncbi:unnamed protein product [Rotaria sp. Silwood2]|nr:unnamed protein product [Rotaria sp. Silwood2]CAF4381414.1 unnamed protein product [Rotaria sp. Silwood2]CAF4404068.1 unnamed protein product [Rotaria sp. Silwood2]CAF4484385.1 unnamed protein product [Rotaria sp. Silwood2]CAF4505342.1 unnamed protein product [Rotaria sp. Silwood2]